MNDKQLARVNISVEVDHGDSKAKTTLPMRLLVLAKLSNDNNSSTLTKRCKVNFTKRNFNTNMKAISPTVSFTATNTLSKKCDDLPVSLAFKHMKDFHPEAIVNNVPELKRLHEMRKNLKNVKNHLLNNPNLRTYLETLYQSSEQRTQLTQEIKQLSSSQYNQEVL